MHLKKNKRISQNNILLIVFIMVTLIACKKATTSNDIWIIEKGSKILDLKFPDSIYKGNLVTGYVKYDLNIDTIDEVNIIDRWLYLYISTESKDLGLSEIKKNNHSIFLDTIGGGEFKVDLRFPNSGYNFINGAIEDIVLVKSNDSTKVLTIVYETNFLRQIMVK